MPRGLVRFQQTGNFHFLTFSCYQRKPFLSPSQARNTFEASLEQTRIRYRFVISGYVVMPEHVHLLVSEPRNGELMRAIQALKISVARRLPQRPFWQRRYYDFNVHSGEKVTEKLNYIHKNPVKRGLVTKPEDWPWSSYRHYQSGERGTVEIESFWTAARRGAALSYPRDGKYERPAIEFCALPHLEQQANVRRTAGAERLPHAMPEVTIFRHSICRTASTI